jgi:hypothetical protein
VLDQSYATVAVGLAAKPRLGGGRGTVNIGHRHEHDTPHARVCANTGLK